ncbi:hypothetical protein MCOR17_010056, partial [Pyricularia oryzae]
MPTGSPSKSDPGVAPDFVTPTYRNPSAHPSYSIPTCYPRYKIITCHALGLVHSKYGIGSLGGTPF